MHMKILYLDWQFYGKSDIIEAMTELGHEVLIDSEEPDNYKKNDLYAERIEKLIKDEDINLVFTSNFYPIISDICMNTNIRYMCWGYDSPYVMLYSEAIKNPCNCVFWFDKSECQRLWNMGIDTVYYMPLGINPERLDKITLSKQQQELFGAQVSLVASIYNEKHNLYDRMSSNLDDYTKGYLEAAMNIQKDLFGGYVLESVINRKDILNSMRKALLYKNDDCMISDVYTYANYFLARKVASMQRLEYIAGISARYDMKVYTPGDLSMIPTAKKMGTVDYMTDMIRVFKASKINLNITLPSIQTGIPLRCMDIMGAGGFLLSNYQGEFFDFFEPGVDFDYYTSLEEAVGKIDFYLKHEDERAAIAHNACERMKADHTVFQRMQDMFVICFGND